MASVDASAVRLGDVRGPLHLEILAPCRRLVNVSIGAQLVRGVARLQGHPIEELALSDVEIDDELRQTLQTLAPTLRRLFLSPTRPFLPSELGNLSKLKQLRQVLVPGFPALKKQWVDCAAAHPAAGFDFFTYNPKPTVEEISVEEIHRKVDILRCVRGKKVSFEISADLAGRGGRHRGNNEDLEDELRVAAKAAKKRVDWRSETDTFTARASDVQTLRWVVDQAIGPI